MEPTKIKLYNKLHAARKYIKTCDMKKGGHNDYSNYNYFTPEQISELVFQASEDQKIIPLFSLKKNEYGHYGVLIIQDLETVESITFEMSSGIPEMKATNITQQLGGAVTYTERYLLMTAFDIKDNGLDPDSKDGKKSEDEPKSLGNRVVIPMKKLTQPEVEDKWNGKIYGKDQVYIDNVKFRVSDEQLEKLKAHPKYQPEKK